MSSGKSGKPLTDFGGLYLPSERIPAAKPIVEKCPVDYRRESVRQWLLNG